MSYGLQVQNSSGIITFDSSKIGRVVVDFFLSPAKSIGGSYTKSYTVPSGRSVEIYCTPSGTWSPVWRTYFTITYSGTSLNISFSTSTITSIFYVLVLLT